MQNVLTIAGSDSCGGAGIQADLKTFSALGTYGMSAITAITAQNTTGVVLVRELDEEIVRAQIDCLFEDIDIHAIKIGMVASAAIIDVIGACLQDKTAPIVLDPVMVSKSGCHLLKPEATQELIKVLFPLARVVTPNLLEAEVITGMKITNTAQMQAAAVKIHEMGACNVVVKGGHLTGAAIDVFFDGEDFRLISGTRINTSNTHGTGCTYSSAVAAYLARGCQVYAAVEKAKEYINGAIENALELGHGVGPTHHFYQFYSKSGEPR
jgi:hydroxymethylpyrimidine/phosphomethylpyrimidine kinase